MAIARRGSFALLGMSNRVHRWYDPRGERDADATAEAFITLTSPMRYVFIVSRDHPWRPWLYDYLMERFKDDPRVEIILDRRVGERRGVTPAALVDLERRKTERRRPVSPDDDLRVRSHYIVEL